MELFYHIVSIIRHRLNGMYSVRRQTQQLDPLLRTALAEEVAPPQHELEHIQQQLEQAQQALRMSQEKEVFLGQRILHYQKQLDARARQLKDDPSSTTEQHEQWENDQTALEKIQSSHKNILAQCETLRRKIIALQTQQTKLLALASTHEQFCQAATEADQRDETSILVQGVELTTVTAPGPHEEAYDVEQPETEPVHVGEPHVT